MEFCILGEMSLFVHVLPPRFLENCLIARINGHSSRFICKSYVNTLNNALPQCSVLDIIEVKTSLGALSKKFAGFELD